jgi:hypothetical protein
VRVPDIRIYSDIDHFLKYKALDIDTKSKINAKARQLIYGELDSLPDEK